MSDKNPGEVVIKKTLRYNALKKKKEVDAAPMAAALEKALAPKTSAAKRGRTDEKATPAAGTPKASKKPVATAAGVAGLEIKGKTIPPPSASDAPPSKKRRKELEVAAAAAKGPVQEEIIAGDGQVDSGTDGWTTVRKTKKAKKVQAEGKKVVVGRSKTNEEILDEIVFGKKAGKEMTKESKVPNPIPLLDDDDDGFVAAASSGTTPVLGPSKSPSLVARATPRSGPRDPQTEAARDFVKQYVELRQQDPSSVGVSAQQLLEEANAYFAKHNADERARNLAAMRKLKEMKKVNRAGGDKDGFKFVVPKNHKQLMKLDAQRARAQGTAVSLEDDLLDKELPSTFGGDGVAETATKPMRKNKRKQIYKDDFYQIQTLKKWTKNAERFLGRSRNPRMAQQSKMTQGRTIKKM